MVLETIGVLGSVIDMWSSKKKSGERSAREKVEAVQLVMNAVVLTKAYLRDLDTGVAPSRDVERELSIKWIEASMAMVNYDHALHQVAKIKSLGWADPDEWARAATRPWAIKLNTIIEQCDFILGGTEKSKQ